VNFDTIYYIHERELLSAFLESASEMLSPRGEIHIALCDGQGGAGSKTIIDWRQSWMAAVFAAEHGLVLVNVFPYEVRYSRLGHIMISKFLLFLQTMLLDSYTYYSKCFDCVALLET
jgi:hypothetical protein